MKKFIVFIITAIILAVGTSFTTKAQWKYTYHDADELVGNEGYYSNLYLDEEGNAFISWNNDKDIKIIANDGIFDYETHYEHYSWGECDAFEYTFVIVGFYTNDKLTEKMNAYLRVQDDNSKVAYTSDSFCRIMGVPSTLECIGLGEKIINHIKNVGDVRIIATKYGGYKMDLRIPHNPQLKYDL